MQIIVTQKDDLLTSQELCLSSDINEAILYELVEHSIAVPIEGEHATAVAIYGFYSHLS